MHTLLNAADPVQLAFLLRDIEAVYLKRAVRLGKPLPTFNRGNLTGTDLLEEYIKHLKTLPRSFADKFGCDPHCLDNPDDCPPCDGEGMSACEEFLRSLRIACAVDLVGLQRIYARYLRREQFEQARNPNFKLPPPPGGRDRNLKDIYAFHQYLKTLPPYFPDKFGCEPQGADNTCPPYEYWEEPDYVAYLELLQKQLNEA